LKNKKVFIIYNPVSGRRTDKRNLIKTTLEKNQIGFDLYETKGHKDALDKAMNFEIEQYSALLLVGGDGTIHEGLNGLMRRQDKKRVPVGLIPNGSGDDICGSFNLQVNDTSSGLNYVLKGDVIKVDIVKILIDCNSEEELQECLNNDDNFKIEDHLRYSFINSNLCVSANIAKNAASMKPKFGQHAYTI